MTDRKRKAQLSFGLLIELVIGTVIVLYLVNIMLKNHFKAPVVSPQEKSMLQREGMADLEVTPAPVPVSAPASISVSPAASVSSAPEPVTTPAGQYTSSIDNYKKMLDKVQQKQADGLKAFDGTQ